MWGPNISFWNKIQRIDKPASQWGHDITNYLSEPHEKFEVSRPTHSGHRMMVEEVPAWDYLIADRQALIDLQIYDAAFESSDHDRTGYKNVDASKRSLLGNGGFLHQLTEQYNSSKLSHQMLRFAGIVREDSAHASRQRTNALNTIAPGLRDLSHFFIETADRDGSKLIDRLFDRNLSNREYVNVADILNLSQLVQFLNQPDYRTISSHIQQSVGSDYWNFVANIGSGKHTLEIDSGLKVAQFQWQNTVKPFNGFAITPSDRESGSYEGSSTVAEYRSVVKQLYAKIIFGDWANQTNGLLRHLAMVEGYVHLLNFASDNSWARAKISDSDNYAMQITAGRHPMYLHSGAKNDFIYDPRKPINNWTGGNDAGKTQFIRGIAQWQLLGQQYGLIPAEAAEIGFRHVLHTNFSRSDDTSKGKYRTSMRRWMREIFTNLDSALVFADEATDGTYVETGILHGLMAFDALAKRKIPTFSATHYGQIAKDIESRGIGRNFHMEVIDGQYTRKLVMGMDLNSRGEEVGSQEGFTQDNLDRIAKKENPLFDSNANSVFMRDGKIELGDEKLLATPLNSEMKTDFMTFVSGKKPVPEELDEDVPF